MNYEQLYQHEKDLYDAFIESIKMLCDVLEDSASEEFMNLIKDNFKAHLKVYEPDR